MTNSDNTTSATEEKCPWCGTIAAHGQMSCSSCGGSLTFKPRKDDSGWIELPPIADMTRLRIGASTCQIEGNYVPVCDFNLAEGDGVYFAHHTLLWRDTSVKMQRMAMRGAIDRIFAGMSIILTEAIGPGHIAFSADVPGEVVAIPLQRGEAIHVREHVFLAATNSIACSWQSCGAYFYTQNGQNRETHSPAGRYLDDFSAVGDHGLLLLHGGGNVFTRTLGPNEWILIKPSAFLFKDPSVRMGMCMDSIPGGVFSQQILWMQLAGPGRIGVQSAYPRIEGENQRITGTSGRVTTISEQYRAGSAMAADARDQQRRARQVLGASNANAGIFPGPGAAAPPTPQALPADYRLGLEKMIRESMVDGLLPGAAMDRIEAEAEKHRLSPYDLQMLIRHVRHGQSGGG